MVVLTLGVVVSSVNQLQAAGYSKNGSAEKAWVHHRLRLLVVAPIAIASTATFFYYMGGRDARIGRRGSDRRIAGRMQ
jgi:hypothetical protein